MLSKKIISFIFIFLIFLSSFIIKTTARDILEDDINSVFNIEFLSGTDFLINIKTNVEKITLDASGTTYSKNDIKNLNENNSEIMGAIKYALKYSLTNNIKTIFEKADIHSLNELPSYKNGNFYDDYIINLTSAYFNFNHEVNVSDFINGILDMSAVINYTFNLIAESGWNNTYNFILPDFIGYHRTNGIVNDNTIQWDAINNNIVVYNKTAEISIKLNNPNSNLDKEDIKLDFNIDCNYNLSSNLNLSIITNSININNLLTLPDFITNLNYIPSDGIRLFIKNYFITWEEFYNNTIKQKIDDIKTIIESSSFNQTVNFSFNWDFDSTLNCLNPFDKYNMDNQPAIKANFSDNDINLLFFGIPSNSFFGIINSGAISTISSFNLNFGENFDNINYPYTINLKLPNNILINDKNIFSWNKTNIVLGNITSNISEEYIEEKIDTNFEILIKTTDLNILSLFTGENKLTFSIYINEIQNRNVTILPDYFDLPDKINLKYFNSDVIRLCIDEKIFDNESINMFLSSEAKSFEYRVKNIFPKIDLKVMTDYNKFDESLLWDKDIKKMGDDYPIKISSYSNIAYSTPFSFSLIPPSLNIIEQNLSLKGIENHNVKYKIIFPQGLKIILKNDSGNIKLNNLENGEYFIELLFNKNQSNSSQIVSFIIKPSFVFIIGLFIPCIISLIITIILVLLIYIIKRKRRIKKVKIIGDNKENYIAHEEQDYYIPPPSSKK